MSLDADRIGAGGGGRGESSAAAYAAADARGVVTGWSEQAARLLGYAPREAVGRPVADLLASPADRERTTARWRTDARAPWRTAVAARHRDGHRVDVTLEAVPLLDAAGRAAVWNLALTPGAAGEDDAAADLVELAFVQSPIAMAIHDRERRVARANDTMTRMIGQTESEMRGRLPQEITPEATRARMVYEEVGRVMRTGEPFHEEAVDRVPGELRPRAWNLTLQPLKDATGEVQGVSVATIDTTEQYMTRQRLSALSEVGARIGTTLDVDRTAQELTELAVPGFADFVTVDLLESVKHGDEPRTVPAGGDDGTVTLWRSAQRSVLGDCPESVIVTGQTGHYPSGSPPARALATGRPAVFGIDDPEVRSWLDRSPDRAESIRAYGIHSLVVAPLVARGTTLGLALFMRHRQQLAFDENDMLLAGEIAARAAVCVDNARRYTRERATALTLQRSLLPRYLPPRPAVEAASRYLPAGSRAGVGGDWFDVIPLSGARVALVVGDVVGHGIRAAATMGRLRTAVRTLADVDLPPDELLTHLDDLVTHRSAEEGAVVGETTANVEGETTAGDVGATCLYAVYDPVSRRCTLARAGHPAPALRLPGGTTRFLDLPPGPPLGLGGLAFESTEVIVPEGSVLALYTDGLIRSRGHDVDDGPDHLRRLLARPAASLDAICDALLETLVPDPPTDDVALLLVRTRALDARQVATWDLPADPAAVSGARARVARQLVQWGLQEASFVTELVASELVTNAIRHADAPIQLRLIHNRSLICEVSDSSSTAPHLRRARVFDEGGRGLLLVAQLTHAWGTRQTTTGKTIWAEQLLV